MKPVLLSCLLLITCVSCNDALSSTQRPVNVATQVTTPNINADTYIPPRPRGRTATVSAAGGSLSAAIQRAQDDPNIASVQVTGGGSIQRSVILKKYTTFDNSTYSCDVTPENTIF